MLIGGYCRQIQAFDRKVKPSQGERGRLSFFRREERNYIVLHTCFSRLSREETSMYALTIAILSDKERSALGIGRGGKGGVSVSSMDSLGSTQASDSTASSPSGMSVCCNMLSLIELASDWSFALPSWGAFPEGGATLASRTYCAYSLLRQCTHGGA